MYTLTPLGIFSQKQESVWRDSDGALIPFDTRNVDYQEYLKWISEGNIPKPCPIVVSDPSILPATT